MATSSFYRQQNNLEKNPSFYFLGFIPDDRESSTEVYRVVCRLDNDFTDILLSSSETSVSYFEFSRNKASALSLCPNIDSTSD